MSWVKVGDEFNGAPEWALAVELAVELGDDRLVAELKGVAMALYIHSAQQFTDYIVSWGAVICEVGIGRAETVVAALIAIGVLVELEPVAGRRSFKLLERENFVHIIKSDDKAKAAKRRNDLRRGGLQVPVMLRDGDACRYCGDPVRWDAGTADDAREYDHRAIDEPTTPANYVTCCRGCNQLRRDLAERAELELPLLDAPDRPIYGAEFLKKLARWTTFTARWTKKEGIPNPLVAGKGDAQDYPAAGRTETPSPTTRAQSLATVGSQPASESQFPDDGRQVSSEGRAVNGSSPQPAGDMSPPPVPSSSPEPPDHQSGCDPRGNRVPPSGERAPANESEDYPASGRVETSRPTTRVQSLATVGSQPSSESQFPDDGRQVSSEGRAVNGSARQPAASMSMSPSPFPSPEPPASQAGCDPRGRQVSHVRDAGPANETGALARRRRRRRRQ